MSKERAILEWMKQRYSLDIDVISVVKNDENTYTYEDKLFKVFDSFVEMGKAGYSNSNLPKRKVGNYYVVECGGRVKCQN